MLVNYIYNIYITVIFFDGKYFTEELLLQWSSNYDLPLCIKFDIEVYLLKIFVHFIFAP